MFSRIQRSMIMLRQILEFDHIEAKQTITLMKMIKLSYLCKN
jgi:hypothetical protein